jgi:hypothetical protein
MGLTIHYGLKSKKRTTEAKALRLVTQLRQAALDLPFYSVSEVWDLSGEACDYNKQPNDETDPVRWLLIQSCGSVTFDRRRTSAFSSGFSESSVSVTPTRVIAFEARPGDGCEAANFGLCQFPPTVTLHDGRVLKTKLSGWTWQSFCKTQYASNPKLGGVQNFLRCHLSVVALLDHAKRLEILEEVSDEGDFWEKRELPALVAEIGSWNEYIAGLGAGLRSFVGPGIVSEIEKFSNVEQLEAAAQNNPELVKLQKLFTTVGAKVVEPPPAP